MIRLKNVPYEPTAASESKDSVGVDSSSAPASASAPVLDLAEQGLIRGGTDDNLDPPGDRKTPHSKRKKKRGSASKSRSGKKRRRRGSASEESEEEDNKPMPELREGDISFGESDSDDSSSGDDAPMINIGAVIGRQLNRPGRTTARDPPRVPGPVAELLREHKDECLPALWNARKKTAAEEESFAAATWETRGAHLSYECVTFLRTWFVDHIDHPYATDVQKQDITTRTGLAHEQVTNWLINQRKRYWQPFVEKWTRKAKARGLITDSDLPVPLPPKDPAKSTAKRNRKKSESIIQMPPQEAMDPITAMNGAQSGSHNAGGMPVNDPHGVLAHSMAHGHLAMQHGIPQQHMSHHSLPSHGMPPHAMSLHAHHSQMLSPHAAHSMQISHSMPPLQSIPNIAQIHHSHPPLSLSGPGPVPMPSSSSMEDPGLQLQLMHQMDNSGLHLPNA